MARAPEHRDRRIIEGIGAGDYIVVQHPDEPEWHERLVTCVMEV